jgi:hypothetical protein
MPVRRYGRVEEVCSVVWMLVQKGYIAGETINVNGGHVYELRSLFNQNEKPEEVTPVFIPLCRAAFAFGYHSH